MTTRVSTERMITFLLTTPMFENLAPDQIRNLTHIVDVIEYQPGEVLFNEGDIGDAWFALYRGKVDVIKSTETEDKEIYPLEQGACFGEIAILDGEPRSATIRAVDQSTVFRISRTAFEELLEQDCAAASKLLRQMAVMLARRARLTTERLSELVREAELKHEVTQIVG